MIRRLHWIVVFALLGLAPAAIAALTPAPAESNPKQAESKPKEAESKPKPSDYDLYKTLIDSLDQIERNYVTEVDRRELIEAAIRGVLSKLDPYSVYISPEELKQFRAEFESEFGGIGIQIDAEAGQLKILSPIQGTPAYRAGLAAGDRILEIDGKSTKGLGIDEAVVLLKGAEGTSVTLTIVHIGDDDARKVTLKREKIHVDTVLGDGRKPDGAWQFMLDPERRIGYVRVTAFSRDTAAELQRALAQLKAEKMRGLILDLRFNPGGLLGAAIETSDLFVSKGRIVSAEGRNSQQRAWDAREEGTFEGFPVAVLVNRFSASASEIVAACLQDHGRAVVIGERTWGKGSVQNLIELADGRGALKLTTASYRRPNGKNIHRFADAKDGDEWGVVPDDGFHIRLGDGEMLELIRDRRLRDVLQPPSAANKPSVVDRQLQAAVKHLTAELAKKR